MRFVKGKMENYTPIDEPICVEDYEILARECLPKGAYSYYALGANDLQTLEESTAALKR